MQSTQRVYGGGRYRDARAAIDWLGTAFGFKPLLIVPGEAEGSVAHAELRLGEAIVMVGSVSEGQLSEVLAPGGQPHPQSIYVVIDEPDAHHARAQAAGAKMLIDLHTADYGSRGYTALDLEGNVWSFGTYRPELPD